MMSPAEHAAAMDAAQAVVTKANQAITDKRSEIARRKGAALIGGAPYLQQEQQADAAALGALTADVDAANIQLEALRSVEVDVRRETQRQRVDMWTEQRDAIRAKLNDLGPRLVDAVATLEAHARAFAELERAELQFEQNAIRFNARDPQAAVELPVASVTLSAPTARDLAARLANIRFN